MIGARCFNQVKCRLGWFVPFPALEGETIFAGETTRSIGLSEDEPALFSPVDMETAESATVNSKLRVKTLMLSLSEEFIVL